MPRDVTPLEANVCGVDSERNFGPAEMGVLRNALCYPQRRLEWEPEPRSGLLDFEMPKIASARVTVPWTYRMSFSAGCSYAGIDPEQ